MLELLTNLGFQFFCLSLGEALLLYQRWALGKPSLEQARASATVSRLLRTSPANRKPCKDASRDTRLDLIESYEY